MRSICLVKKTKLQTDKLYILPDAVQKLIKLLPILLLGLMLLKIVSVFLF